MVSTLQEHMVNKAGCDGMPGPELLAASPHAIELAIHHAVRPILLTPLTQTLVTDDTDDTTFGKLFRRGDRGDFP
jgi:hypothetical protein